jgi:hypothetical protein
MTNRQQARSHTKRGYPDARCQNIDYRSQEKDKGRVSEERIDRRRTEKKREVS